MSKGLLVVVSAPSGCGKDTIVSQVISKMPDDVFLSVSMTTRPIRGGETDGVHYYFVTKEEFKGNIEKGEMLEYAIYGDNYYGTPAAPVRKLLDEGKVVVLIIEVEGGGNIKKMFPDACKIFICPPSFAVLEQRLRKRGTETEEAIAKRLKTAKHELTRAYEYDYIVVNDALEDAVDDVIAIIRAERLRINKTKNLISEVIENA